MLSGHSAIIWPADQVLQWPAPCPRLADPMVRRIPRSTVFTASLDVGGSWPARLVVVADGGAAAADGRGLQPDRSQMGQIGRDDADMGWQGSPLYPPHWRELSSHVRFERAGGRCQRCRRPHLSLVRCLPDGRWFDEQAAT
jgi:hypothetical protein